MEVFPKINKKAGTVEIGDGQVMSIKDYNWHQKENRKKCKRCNHKQESHYGQCRHSKGTMDCNCGGFVR